MKDFKNKNSFKISIKQKDKLNFTPMIIKKMKLDKLSEHLDKGNKNYNYGGNNYESINCIRVKSNYDKDS